MNDFTFDFTSSNDQNYENEGNSSLFDVDGDHCALEVQWTETDRINTLKTLAKVEHAFGTYLLTTLSSTALENYLMCEKESVQDSCNVIKAISVHSDLVAGQYEGGLKVWECSIDLCEYFLACGLPVKGCNVLDLGCGAGLSGIMAAKMGASAVHFQDFNKEVIQNFTMVNVKLNKIDESVLTFFSGDWGNFATLAEASGYRYDLILTSETIYNVKSYSKLLKVFTKLLSDTGVILIAAKMEYFGVGGSIHSFTDYLKSNSHFKVGIARQIETGVPRVILKVTRS